MAHRSRIYYTAEQRAEIWDRWQRGESLNAIGRVFDRHSASMFGVLKPTGGIRPPPRKRSSLALTLAEREEISRGVVSDLSIRSIAVQLGRSPSTISREINRNGGLKRYRASQADQAAWDRALRGIEPFDRNPVNWPGIQPYGGSWPENSDATGHRNKSRAG